MLNLPEYVHITQSTTLQLRKIIDEINPDRIGMLVDENTKKYCLPKLDDFSTDLIEIKSGEAYKTLGTCNRIWSQMTDLAFTRKSLLINLGGGVIGDMGGFAATTYKRGIPFINIPTTLLSQVDASIGGKLGVDFEGLKNHIGVFQDPTAVIIDSTFLETLPRRQLLSGYAEVVKHALIHDREHWERINSTPFDELDWAEIIPKSISIKDQIVKQDPLENGLRKILNFGHTLGHAIESYFLNSATPLLHGEAIAIGMILEAHLSFQLNMISQNEFQHIRDHLQNRYSLPKKLPEKNKLENYLLQDKKNTKGLINFSLIEKVGSCVYDQHVTPEHIISSIDEYTK